MDEVMLEQERISPASVIRGLASEAIFAIPLKSPCQPFSLELSNPGVCTQALNLLGFVSPGRAVCQRRVITHRVSLAPLRFKTSCPHPQGASYVLPSADIIPLWPRISSAKSGPNSIAKGRCE